MPDYKFPWHYNDGASVVMNGQNYVIVHLPGDRDDKPLYGNLIASIGSLWAALETISMGLPELDAMALANDALINIDRQALALIEEQDKRLGMKGKQRW